MNADAASPARRRRFLALLLSLLLVLGASAAQAGKAAAKAAARAGSVFRLRPDLRACEPPLCGGFFVSEVNRDLTRCADGTQAPECYVVRLEAAGKAVPDAEALTDLASAPEKQRGLLRGDLMADRKAASSAQAILRVTEAWRPAGEGEVEGSFFHVRDAGIRCVKAPCPSIRAVLLNEATELSVAEVDLERAKASPAELERAADALANDGILVAGAPDPASAPSAGVLLAARLYLRVGAGQPE